MNELFYSSLDCNKHFGTFVMRMDNRCKGLENDQLCERICTLLKINPRTRVKASFRHFYSSTPKDSYVKFTVVLKQDSSVIALAAKSGGIGFAPHLFEAYEYLECTDVIVWSPKGVQLPADIAAHFLLTNLQRGIIVAEKVISDKVEENNKMKYSAAVGTAGA